MARDSSQEIPLRGNSRHTSIHPVDINGSPLPRASPGPGGYTQVKHYKKWFPWMIPAFVIANTVVFIITMYVNDCPKYGLSCVAPFLHRFSFQPFKENPLLGPSSDTLEKMGGLDVNKVIHGYQGWRLISCIWLHAGVFHLLANMLSLLIIGIRLEREFGFVKIGVLYNIAGIGGSVLSALFVRSNISVGASGAVFGLLGAMLSELIINWTIYSNKVASFIMLVIIILVNLGVGVLPHVDNFAHIGGFLSGFLLGFVFLIRPHFGWVSQKYVQPSYALNSRRPHKYKKYQYALWIISLILLIIGFTVGLMLLFKGVDANSRCSWCHYLSCVPTSRWSCKTQPGQCTFDDGYPKNLTCVTNGKSKLYYLSNITGPQLQGLCAQLCN